MEPVNISAGDLVGNPHELDQQSLSFALKHRTDVCREQTPDNTTESAFCALFKELLVTSSA